ncbi:Pentatricopeptide repeat-containing protein [Acorus calamus]|uniref:Pentatricopeptide repeat-containing protein n=1 Tax=Acorus calamus TaxID=4465 RepID=A0AAV9EAC5_ACOCL|nr:Pentatricopeptide repeat-containing protein [Acorus calamus]
MHGLVIKGGYVSFDFVVNSLIAMYARCGELGCAWRLFKGAREREDVVLWNTIISGCSQSGRYIEALGLFREMQSTGVRMNSYTVVGVLQACAELSLPMLGREVHAGPGRDLKCLNPMLWLLCMRSPIKWLMWFGCLRTWKRKTSWNSVLSGYVQSGSHAKAVELFRRMIGSDHKPDSVSIISVASASGRSGNLLNGKEIHAYTIKRELDFELEVENTLIDIGLTCLPYLKQIHAYMFRHNLLNRVHVLGNSIIDVYGDCGEVEYAIRAFENIENKDIVCWTSMISCYVHNGLKKETLELFYDMKQVITEFDEVILVTILAAIANLSLLKKGKEIHGFLSRKGFTIDGPTGGALVDMYSRCGSFEISYRMFNRIERKDLVSWTTMINA